MTPRRDYHGTKQIQIDNEEKHWNPEVIYIAGANNEISNNIMTFTGTYDGSINPSTGIFLVLAS